MFSSYGTEASSPKPDLGAPGGLIRSTYPLEDGAYATISGTSMASPHVAGAVRSCARPSRAWRRGTSARAPEQRRSRRVVGEPGVGAPRHRPSAGRGHARHRRRDRVDDDGLARQAVPRRGRGRQATLRLTNSGSSSVTYASPTNARSRPAPQTFAPLVNDFWLPDTTVTFSSPSVTVPAGGSDGRRRDRRRPDPRPGSRPTGSTAATWSDELGRRRRVYRVPYLGFKGDYQSIVAMPNAPVSASRAPRS